MKNEEESDNNRWGILIFFAFIALLYTIAHFLKNNEWQKRTHKTTMAKRYGLEKGETLMRWIEKYCPDHISNLYVGKQIQYIKNIDVIIHLGKPESYPKDGQNRKITSKAEMARAFNVSDRVINRRIKELENPKETIGLSKKQYSEMRKTPPIFANKIFNYLVSIGLEPKKPKLPLT